MTKKKLSQEFEKICQYSKLLKKLGPQLTSVLHVLLFSLCIYESKEYRQPANQEKVVSTRCLCIC